ncbi:hypothetical protein BDW22DRAFT_1342611 [Trametopsis cervina]|nr:hypothetical protein BDW22DRAFT_1342611 [Trametopsis cervina]
MPARMGCAPLNLTEGRSRMLIPAGHHAPPKRSARISGRGSDRRWATELPLYALESPAQKSPFHGYIERTGVTPQTSKFAPTKYRILAQLTSVLPSAADSGVITGRTTRARRYESHKADIRAGKHAANTKETHRACHLGARYSDSGYTIKHYANPHSVPTHGLRAHLSHTSVQMTSHTNPIITAATAPIKNARMSMNRETLVWIWGDRFWVVSDDISIVACDYSYLVFAVVQAFEEPLSWIHRADGPRRRNAEY